jgi:putative ABC transport system permease protein
LRRSLLEHRVHRGLRWLTLAGGVALPTGWWLAGHAAYGLVGGYLGLFLVIGGYSLLVPPGVNLLSRIGGRLACRAGLLTRLTLRGIDANLSRTGLAIAALGVAVAATLGVSIMIGSFRATVVDWLGYTLSGDIYVSALSSQTGDDGVLPPQVRARIRSLPGVAATSGGRRVTVASDYGDVTLLALDPAARSQSGFRFVAPPLADLWPRYRRGELLLVSEPYAWHHNLRTGDSLQLHTPRGSLTLPIGGIFYDYGSERGLVSLAHASYAHWWNDATVSTLGVFLEPGVATAGVVAAIHRALDGLDVALRIRSDREIREQSLAIFDRTFAITRVLRLLAIGVAFVGVFSALMALQLERTREQAILRATGVTPGQLARLTLAQTGLMGVYAGVLSLPLGGLMASVLIDVINRRAFGWSIEAQLPPAAVPEALLLAVGAALLAGLYPAWRMRRVQPALALRAE